MKRSRAIPRALAWIMIEAGLCACVLAGPSGSGTGIFSDPVGDAVYRRTDLGNDAPLPMGSEPIDLLEVRVEGWEPFVPTVDPYSGQSTGGDAELLRMQVVLDGLVCPPGPLALDGSAYQPYLFGDRPLFGYIELDVDSQKNSGGELTPLANNRYLANVGRFGISPRGSLSERMVRNADDMDTNIFIGPQFERTGGEFTLQLCGCFTPTIVSQDGDLDSVFDPGETWVVSGRFFERFASFQPLSALFGGSDFGLFDPVVELRFEHNIISDRTTVTLVFPITNEGASLLTGASTEEEDLNLLNQTSMEEAIEDLIDGADFASGALGELSDPWRNRQADDYRRPSDWFVHAIIGTASTQQDPSSLFIWTDTGFDEVAGDLNDDDLSNSLDSQIVLDAISQMDGGVDDADGIVNGSVMIPNFAFSFDVRDLNGDGFIDDDDQPVMPCLADLSGDGLLNFFDVSAFLTAFNAQSPQADFTGDGVYNFFDVSAFLSAFAAGCP